MDEFVLARFQFADCKQQIIEEEEMALSEFHLVQLDGYPQSISRLGFHHMEGQDILLHQSPIRS